MIQTSTVFSLPIGPTYVSANPVFSVPVPQFVRRDPEQDRKRAARLARQRATQERVAQQREAHAAWNLEVERKKGQRQ